MKQQSFGGLARLLLAAALVASPYARAQTSADAGPSYGAELEGFEYAFPVNRFDFVSQGDSMHMTFLDVAPLEPNGQTVLLLHGKSFCAGTWQTSIEALTAAGYRVIAPDQIGFCKSTKPAHYQYSFEQLAHNTHALLDKLDIHQAVIVGHSTGGMLAVRYALMYPKETRALVLVDPVGLEDWQAKGVPWPTVDQWYERDLKTTAQRIRAYEQDTYYRGKWDPSFDKWVQMQAGMYRGPGKNLVAWNSALIYDMIFTQPVVYQFDQLQPATLLIIGDLDNTAIGKDLAPPAVRDTLGHYAVLGKQAAKMIPHADLVEFADLGHAPQIQDPVRFHAALLAWLSSHAR
jgi:pimeloyl-ACP methyl ester carboxylesterase